MKIRNGFVSNSSSSSFVIHLTDDKMHTHYLIDRIRNAGAVAMFRHLANETDTPVDICYFSDYTDKPTDVNTIYGYVDNNGSTGWHVQFDAESNTIECETSMDDFDLLTFVEEECKELYEKITDIWNS